MRQVAVEHAVAQDVAPGGTFTVSYPSGYTQADFSGAPSTTSVNMVDYDDLATTLGATEATLTWPADAPGPLTAGTIMTIGLGLVDEIPASLNGIIANIADSTAADVPGLVADFNSLLAALKASGLMAPDA